MRARAFFGSVLGCLPGLLAACGSSTADDGPDGGNQVTGGTSSGGASSGGTSSGGTSGGAALGGSASSLGGTHPGSAADDCHTDGDGRTTLAFVNRCALWLDYAGSDIAGGRLAPGQLDCVDIGSDEEPLSAKRYWGFSGEDPGGEHHSLAEFTFNTDFYDFDWYNISFVDAFNLPLRIVPVARPECDALTCAEDLLIECPSVGLYQDSTGQVTSCVSPDRDDPESPVALYFEQCDDAYAWSGDDQEGADPSPVKACAGEDWDIVFCPERG
jgi:hypothetical protein